jgi:acetylornithine aminotransferase/acetylornithine/N-succinyldiaminopimelate aminotransferase
VTASATDGADAAGGRHLFGTYRRLPVAFDHGEGARLWDVEGREYLDFVGGIAVTSLGHSHPELVEALRDQSGRLLHVSNLFRIPEQAEAARALAEASGLDRAFFCNSGTEAVEAAIKLARKRARDRGRGAGILVAEGAFHGRTLGALAATAEPAYRDPFRPLPGGFRRVPWDDLGAARAAMGPEVCAVLVEPVQGEAGVVPPSDGYLRGLQETARRHGALFVLDEVQTGVGRTGAPFAFQRFDLEPDAVALAKGLGGGVPVGALVAREDVARHLGPGDHASTFGGNPLAARAASTVLGVLRRDGLAGRADAVGRHLRGRLEEAGESGFPVRRVRGLGLLVAFDVPGSARALTRACLEEGLLINAVGDSTVRLAPPLVVTRDEVDRAMELLRAGLSRLPSSRPGGT